MKFFILGHGRHGKDTVAEILRDHYGILFESSSMLCAEHVVRPWLKEKGLVYESLEKCYADRANHRIEWYNAIKDFNTPDLSRVSRTIFSDYDMYVGIRDRDEFLTSAHLADLSIWVDAFERIPQTDPTCKVLRTDADIIIDNNTSMEDLEKRVRRLFDFILQKEHKWRNIETKQQLKEGA